MAKLGLRARLFLSHMIVMVVGLSTLLTVGKVFSPRLFVLHLEQMEGSSITLIALREDLVEGFEYSNSQASEVHL